MNVFETRLQKIEAALDKLATCCCPAKCDVWCEADASKKLRDEARDAVASMRHALAADAKFNRQEGALHGYETTMREFAEEVELREQLPDGVLVWMENQTYRDLQKYKP